MLIHPSSPGEIVQLLSTELRLTFAYLQVHPKVYWIWNHRKWCLTSVPVGPEESEEWRNEFWKTELKIIEKMLDSDARNCEISCFLSLRAETYGVESVHAWGYRRYVLSNLPESFTPKRSAADELRYTKKKIEANFSNFSAWHWRTKVLDGVWEGLASDDVECAKNKGGLKPLRSR